MNEKRLKYQNYLKECDMDDFLVEYNDREHYSMENSQDCYNEMERRLKIVDKAKQRLEELKSAPESGYSLDSMGDISCRDSQISILESLFEE